MFNQYGRSYCQNNYNPQIIETICNNVGTKAEFDMIFQDFCNCGCNNINDNLNNFKCGFEEENIFPLNPMLAQSYVPIQKIDKVFTPCCGLKMGTIFPELVSVYIPCQSMMENDYLKRTSERREG